MKDDFPRIDELPTFLRRPPPPVPLDVKIANRLSHYPWMDIIGLLAFAACFGFCVGYFLGFR